MDFLFNMFAGIGLAVSLAVIIIVPYGIYILHQMDKEDQEDIEYCRKHYEFKDS